jgi:hypothetical protein
MAVLQIYSGRVPAYVLLFVIFGMCILRLYAAAWIAGVSSDVFGTNYKPLSKRMREVTKGSATPTAHFKFWINVYSKIVLIISLFNLKWFPLALLLICVWIEDEAKVNSPPFVLLLGVSGARTRELRRRIIYSIRPLRMTDLLRVERNRDVLDAMAKAVTQRRRLDDTKWLDTVAELSVIACIVVIDVRETTTAVLQEVELLSRLKLQFKAVLVRGGDNRERQLVPVLHTSALTDASSEIPTIEEDRLISLLALVRRHPAFVPRKEQPISRTLRSF